jgi:hypothetical protein
MQIIFPSHLIITNLIKLIIDIREQNNKIPYFESSKTPKSSPILPKNKKINNKSHELKDI